MDVMYCCNDDIENEQDEEFDEDEAGRDATVGRPEGDFEQGSYSSGSGYGQRRNRRRPSTTEAKERRPLDDDDDEEEGDLGSALQRNLHFGEGPFADPIEMDEEEEEEDSDDDELVEIRPRRTS